MILKSAYSSAFRISSWILLAAIVLPFSAAQAQTLQESQDVPSDLSAPAPVPAPVPTQAPALDPAPVAAETDDNDNAAAQDAAPSSAVSLPYSDDPCPEAQMAINERPKDLSMIQADIMRFSLCVERAQLLERLNTLAKENIETIDSALQDDLAAAMPPLAVTGTGGTQSGTALPPPLPTNGSFSSTAADMAAIQNPAPAGGTDWQIKNISGQDTNLTAQLVNGQGTIKLVHAGEKISDDLTVKGITATGVTVADGKEAISLDWAE